MKNVLNTKTLTAAALATFLFAGTAFAQSSGAASGPTIDGGVEMTVSAEQDVSAAIGNESSATQEIGAIDSGTITGDIATNVEAAEDVSAAIGNKACSDQKIGTIGSKNAC